VNATVTITVQDGGQGETQRAVSHCLALSVTGMSAQDRRDVLDEKVRNAAQETLSTFLDCIESEEAEAVDVGA